MDANSASTVAIERNIVKEIMRECFPKKVRANENFVHFLVKLLLLDPNWGITHHFVTRDKVAKFVEYVIDRLAAPNDPKLVTLQMQFYFTCNLDNIHSVPDKSRKEVVDRLYPLKHAIFEIDMEFEENITDLSKKIVSYVTLVSGLGNPKQEVVYREGIAALKSIMSEEELKEFTTYPREKKEIELVRMCDIISGIRLFNKECQRGGSGIEELPALLDAAIKSVRNDMENTLYSIVEKVNILTTVTDQCYVIQKQLNTTNEYEMQCKLSHDIENIYMENIKDLLVFYRQYELYIRQIIKELDNIEVQAEMIQNEFQDVLDNIQSEVYMKIAVPAATIFPPFQQLANTWSKLQDQVIILAKFSDIAVSMEVYSKTIPYSQNLLESFIDEIITDAERLEETNDMTITTDNSDVKIYSVESFPDVDEEIDLQYLGFCCWKLVETNGALIPGNPGMGVAQYDNKNYVFSIPEACEGFTRNPTDYIKKVLDMARKRPYLIKFLSLEEELEKVKHITVLAEIKIPPILTENKAVETGDFEDIVPPFIDKKYFWNIWDLKREALLLADVSRRKTVSVQTIKTFSKNCMKNQTSGMRSRIQQTMKDNYTNVPKPSNFIYGLRGRKDNEQFIIDLTRPVDE